jgi:hypothetical protein
VINVLLGNKQISVSRPKLKVWIHLEDIRGEIKEAEDENEIVHLLFSYVSKATAISIDELELLPWYEIMDAYNSIVGLCAPMIDFPILRYEEKDVKKEVWDYDERSWYMWANTLASEYGWKLEYIAELDVDDAIGLLEEIYLSTQLEREWEWSSSEIAYPYDSRTKKSNYKPLPRPQWMQGVNDDIIKKATELKVPASYLPVGKGIKWVQ